MFSNCFLVCFDRRLDPTEKPLQIVHDYLAGLGFDDPVRMQEEAANSDLSCMIRFYSGKKLCVHTVTVGVALTVRGSSAETEVIDLMGLSMATSNTQSTSKRFLK